MKPRILSTLVLASLGLFLSTAKSDTAKPAYSGEWTVISDGILAELTKDQPTSKDTFTRKTAGVAVDRTNGDVYLMANNIGICKSTDQGQTFALVSGHDVTGRFETGCGINVDPAGGRLMCFSIYGSCAYSADAGKTWTKSTLSHLDYGAVDWSDTGKALLAVGHESGGKLVYSDDAGVKWKTLGKEYWAVGLFDHKTLLASIEKKDGIVRSTDDGATWTKVSDEKPACPVMVVFKGTGYWLGEHSLMQSSDSGATWTAVAPLPKGACLGPMFGKDASQMMVGATDGLFESKDAGKTWELAVPLAPEIKVLKGAKFANYGWDPARNIFYASQMTKPAYKYAAK